MSSLSVTSMVATKNDSRAERIIFYLGTLACDNGVRYILSEEEKLMVEPTKFTPTCKVEFA
jgi:hypothetical protein